MALQSCISEVVLKRLIEREGTIFVAKKEDKICLAKTRDFFRSKRDAEYSRKKRRY